MIRILLASLFLITGTTLFCAFQSSATHARQQARQLQDDWQAQTQRVTQTRIEFTTLTTRLHELKQRIAALPESAADELRAFIKTNHGHVQLPAGLREKMLAELGFDWSSTGEYLVVTKQTLENVSLDAMRGTKLTAAVCGVLAITPDERSTLETVAQQIATDYKNWATNHMQREEPRGDVVAKYTLPPDPEMSLSLSNTFASAVTTTLGDERAELFQKYSADWLHESGIFGDGSTTLIVKRYSNGQENRLGYELHQGGSTISSDVGPYQFPEAFRPIFPKGWPDLAEREGFALSKEFNKKTK